MAIPVMVELNAASGNLFNVLGQATSALGKMGAEGEASAAKMSGVATTMSLGLGAAAVVVADKSVKMATDFEAAMTHLVTSADLPKSAVKDLGDQFMTLSTQVGVSATDLANASYYVLSEGYNWQGTSNIMHAAAELSKIDQADLTDTTRALVTTMHDYGASSSEAVNYGNAFRQMLALSGTNMQSLMQNMGRVDQVAHALGITFGQTAGALATLTKEGMDGAQAETLLSTAMGHLAGDTPKMSKELERLGINVQQFQQRLASPDGLVGAVSMVTDAIRNHLGPDGLVYLQDALTKSKGNLDTFAQAMGKAPADVQSYVAALGDAMGGTRNLGVILGLTGPNFDTFKSNVDSVSAALKTGGTDVSNWSDVTQTLSFKSKQLNADTQDLAIKLGNLLLPAISNIVGGLDKFASFLDRNRFAADAFGVALGILAAGGMASVILKIGTMVGSLGTLANALTFGGAAKLATWFTATLVPSIGAGIAAIARFAFAWAVIGWESIVTGLGGLATAITTRVVPALLSATAASWSFTASLLANPITWFVAAIVIGLAYVIFWIWAFANNWHGVTALVAGYMEQIVTFFYSGWVRIVTFLSSTVADIESMLTSMWANIVSGVVSFGETLYSTFIQPFLRVLGYLAGLVGQFEGIGRDLIMGMVRGVEAAAGAVISAVQRVVQDAANAAKAIAHIFSPSRLFADEIGQYISLGIAAGITEHGPSVSAAVSGVVSGAANGSSLDISGSAGLGRAGMNNQAQEVHFHLEVKAPIIGSNLQQAAEELWQEFLRMQRQGTLGISGSISVGF